jgi:hypothetical protein
VNQRVVFEGENYFRDPTLLEFVAENPIRHGTLPSNIVALTEIILDAGAEQSALKKTLGLVCSGCVSRECRVQVPLIDLLCNRGADPNTALHMAAAHGEFDALNALIGHGARVDLPVAAALGQVQRALELLPGASPEDRHRALALASQFGQVEIVRALLDAGEDPNRYNPAGFHSHSTPVHQAAFAGHRAVVLILLERGGRTDLRDLLWQGTPADWAERAGNMELSLNLRAMK